MTARRQSSYGRSFRGDPQHRAGQRKAAARLRSLCRVKTIGSFRLPVTARTMLLCTLAIGNVPSLWGQHVSPWSVRLEAGSLNSDSPVRVTLAVGGTIGWRLTQHGTLLVRYIRQSRSGFGTDIGRYGRNFVMLNWEHSYGDGKAYQRQLLWRLGAGAMFGNPFLTAPVVGGGFEVRYPVADHWAFLANIEDDIAAQHEQEIALCMVNNRCFLYKFPRELQHNFGLIVAGEWRP